MFDTFTVDNAPDRDSPWQEDEDAYSELLLLLAPLLLDTANTSLLDTHIRFAAQLNNAERLADLLGGTAYVRRISPFNLDRLTEQLSKAFDRPFTDNRVILGVLDSFNKDTFIRATLARTQETYERMFERVVAPKLIKEYEKLVIQGISPITSSGKTQLVNSLTKTAKDLTMSDNYWRVVSNQALNQVYNFGVVRSGFSAGARAVRYVATLDDRTTTVCRSLDGTEWSLVEADNILTEKAFLDLDGIVERDIWNYNPEGRSRQDLLSAGVITPPLHPHCRSYLDLVF